MKQVAIPSMQNFSYNYNHKKRFTAKSKRNMALYNTRDLSDVHQLEC